MDNYWKDRYEREASLLKVVWTTSLIKSLIIVILVFRLAGGCGGHF